MSELWQIQCFGSLKLIHSGREIHRFYSQHAGLLVASLVFAPDHRAPRETLIERLWPEVSLEIGRNRLKQTLSALRREIETLSDTPTLFLADRFQIGLDPSVFRTDVAEFQSALHPLHPSPNGGLNGTQNPLSLEKACGLLRAIELYRGELLSGYYADWVITERRRLADLYSLAMSQLLEALEAEKDILGATELAHRLAALEPYQEEPQRVLIRLALASQNPEAARHSFHLFKQRLQEDLNAEPSEELGRLITHNEPTVPEATPRRLPLAFAPQRARFPMPVTRFFGRIDELERLRNLLTGTNPPRLITLLGMGGCGKTRLSLELGQRLSRSFYRERVFFIPLEDVTHASRLLEMIALNLHGGTFLTEERLFESVIAQLNRDPLEAPTLLILDNFEQLTGEASAALILRLLREVPQLRLLVSSRQPLGLQGEVEFQVLPLSTSPPERASLKFSPSQTIEQDPLAQIPAVQLLRDRLERVCPERTVKAHSLDTLLALSRKLEGIPLAIELAASWGRSLSPEEMLERLHRPFALLTSRTHDLPERQRSMYGVLEQSFELMTDKLQAFFVSLAVFQGGFTLEVAEQILLPDALDSLIELQERSLLLVETPDEPNGETRYRLLDTVREFALLKLPSARKQELQRAHAQEFARFAATGNTALYQNRSSHWNKRFQGDYSNLLSALEWAKQEPPLYLEIAAHLLNYWMQECRFKEGLTALETGRHFLDSLPKTEEATRLLANYWMAVGVLGYYDERSDARDALQKSLDLWREIGESMEAAQCLHYLAILTHEAAGHEKAEPLYLQSMGMRERCHDLSGRVSSLQMLGRLYGHVQCAVYSPEKSAACFRASLTLAQEIGDKRREGAVLHFMATAAGEQGDEATSFAYAQKALQIFRAEHNRIGIFATCCHRPNLGRPDIETENLQEMARFYLDTGRPEKTASLLARCFSLAMMREQWTVAGKLAGVLASSNQADAISPDQQCTLAVALADSALAAAQRDGATLSPVRAVSLFLADAL